MKAATLIGEKMNQSEISVDTHIKENLHYIFLWRSLNGSARGLILYSNNNGKWAAKDKMKKLGFVCETKIYQSCIFDMVEYTSSCLDFRLNPNIDEHSWDAANQGCKDYGMQMLQISTEDKDEFINDYLWNTGLFTLEGGATPSYKGIWLAAHGK